MRFPFLLAGSAALLCAQTGLFEGAGDVGAVLHPGSAQYDAARKAYRISGSGENMWASTDAFQYVWKKVSGDVTITADVSILGTGGDAHRKAALMIRQSLDADSAYADAALHGNGLTSLQSRPEKGAATYEIQSWKSAPKRLRLVKRGDDFFLFVAAEDGDFHFSGGSVPMKLSTPFYVGLAVCAHNKDRVETAEFTNVDISPTKSGPGKRYSTVEVVPYPPGDRRAVAAAAGEISRIGWRSNGEVYFTRGKALKPVPLSGEPKPPEPFTELPAPAPRVSPDGARQWSFARDASGAWWELRVLTTAEGKVQTLARFLSTETQAAWSPDGKKLAFVTEATVPE